MTNEQAKQLAELIQKMVRDSYPNAQWYIQLIDDEIPGKSYHFGNSCPRCAFDEMKSWIDDNDIQHLQDESLPESIN